MQILEVKDARDIPTPILNRGLGSLRFAVFFLMRGSSTFLNSTPLIASRSSLWHPVTLSEALWAFEYSSAPCHSKHILGDSAIELWDSPQTHNVLHKRSPIPSGKLTHGYGQHTIFSFRKQWDFPYLYIYIHYIYLLES